MFGPFEKSVAAESFRQLLRHANLVFARDVKSLDYARAAGGPTENLYLAPDITIFMEPEAGDQLARVNGAYACLVPNVRTPRNGHPRWREVYVDRMAEVGRLLARQGVKTLLADAQHRRRRSSARQPDQGVYRRESMRNSNTSDPLAIKSFIAHSRLIVASRYHSVVGALSSGVPAIVLGWAHKYDTLLDDFNVPDLIHHATDTKEHLLELVNALLDESEWARRRDILLAAKSRMVAANQLMWQQVNETLGLNAQSLTR
jgi:colanic acid/amylovoran biosynthesis protein